MKTLADLIRSLMAKLDEQPDPFQPTLTTPPDYPGEIHTMFLANLISNQYFCPRCDRFFDHYQVIHFEPEAITDIPHIIVDPERVWLDQLPPLFDVLCDRAGIDGTDFPDEETYPLLILLRKEIKHDPPADESNNQRHLAGWLFDLFNRGVLACLHKLADIWTQIYRNV